MYLVQARSASKNMTEESLNIAKMLYDHAQVNSIGSWAIALNDALCENFSKLLKTSRKSNSGRKERTVEEEDLATKESKMTMRSHGVRLGGKMKMGLKQLVGHSKW